MTEMQKEMTEQQKRTFEEAESYLDDVRVIILDIEGTTTPFTFVKDNLFPYVKNNLQTYLTTNYDKEETVEDIKCLCELAAKDKEEGKKVTEIPESNADNKDVVVKALVANVLAQMDEDRKSTALKQLQGHMWREAYKSSDVVGELFEDVNPVLSQLNEEGYKLFIYSSGSIEAQKLLFQNSIDGDITELFSGYFDTTLGSKKDPSSYTKMKKEIESKTKEEYLGKELLFLTDDPEEATAARKADLQVIIVDRANEQDGGIEITKITRQNFPVILSLNDLFGVDDEDDDEFGMIKRPHLADNGDFDDDEDDDDEEDDDDDEDDDDEEDEDDDGVGIELGGAGGVEDEDDDGEEDDEEEEA